MENWRSEKRQRACNIVIHGVNETVGVEKNDGKQHAMKHM